MVCLLALISSHLARSASRSFVKTALLPPPKGQEYRSPRILRTTWESVKKARVSGGESLSRLAESVQPSITILLGDSCDHPIARLSLFFYEPTPPKNWGFSSRPFYYSLRARGKLAPQQRAKPRPAVPFRLLV